MTRTELIQELTAEAWRRRHARAADAAPDDVERLMGAAALALRSVGPVLAAKYNGATPTISVILDEDCPACQGTGEVRSHNPSCWDCGGMEIEGKRYRGRRHTALPTVEARA